MTRLEAIINLAVIRMSFIDRDITKEQNELIKTTFQCAIEALQEVSIRIPRWIPVSERLPEGDQIVLGTDSCGDLYVTDLWDDCGEIKCHANGCYDVPIVAWMPLPEPYIESEE